MDAQQGIPLDSPPPAETEDEGVQRDASLFLQFLQSDPGGRAYIDRTIRQHLQGGIGPETWGNILGGLTLYHLKPEGLALADLGRGLGHGPLAGHQHLHQALMRGGEDLGLDKLAQL